MDQIEVGTIVKPITEAGLWLSTEPYDGRHDQELRHACVLRGLGVVLEVKDVVVDYDTWPDSKDDGLGKVTIRCCYIRCTEGKGWGSAVVPA